MMEQISSINFYYIILQFSLCKIYWKGFVSSTVLITINMAMYTIAKKVYFVFCLYNLYI